MTTLCHTPQTASHHVLGWLRRQPELKEESITDWLLDYFDQNSSQLRYYQFNRHEEGRVSGADWDWWFIQRHGCFKLRIQAKKLRTRHNHYSDLARCSNAGHQLDLLLDSSAQLNFYPLYSLYGPSQGAERCACAHQPTSLHICSAQEVYNLVFGSARIHIDSARLLSLTIPLHCLFCCPLTFDKPDGGPESLFDHYFSVPPRYSVDEDAGEDPHPRRGYEGTTPPIIKRLFEVREVNSNTEGLLQEYQSMFSGTDGVVIADISKKMEG